jgi:guanylate kinase
VSVFIEPPSLEELVRRLRNRNTEADADIEARLAESRIELQAMEEFDHKVLNDDVDAAGAELERIVERVTRATDG